MPIRAIKSLLVLFLCFACGLSLTSLAIAETSTTLRPERKFTVAISLDGQVQYFDELISAVKNELMALADGDYELAFKVFDAEWDSDQMLPTIRAAINDPEVDLVIAAGVGQTELAARLSENERTTPVIGAAIRYASARMFPIGEEGTSTLKNFNFIANPRRVESDLEALLSISHSKQVHVLVDPAYISILKRIENETLPVEEQLGIDIEFVPVGATADDTLAAVPNDARSVYVTFPLRFYTSEKQRLFAGLTRRGIVTACMRGVSEVSLGCVLGLDSASVTTVARRIALNAHQYFNGIPIDELLVYLPVEDRLTVNASSIAQLGIGIEYDTLLAANFVMGDLHRAGETLSLEDAMSLAQDNNAGVLIQKADFEISRQDKNISSSDLLPQILSEGFYRHQDFDSIDDPLTPDHRATTRYGLMLSQMLYDDSAISTFRAQKREFDSSRYELESARLDAAAAAGQAFLDLLATRALFDIERENLRITENNLELAKIRFHVGAADQQEVFRWESNQARQRSAVLERRSQMKIAEVNLNQALGVERTKAWNPEEILLTDTNRYFLDPELSGMLDNTRNWGLLREFLKEFAGVNSVEIKSFDKRIEAQGIRLRERKRSFFLPKFTFETGLQREHRDSPITVSSDENEWFIGGRASLPIFEGARRAHQVSQRMAELDRLKARRRQALEFVEQNTLNAHFGMGSAHPRIRFSRIALEASQKNFDSVKEKYTQGVATILDLLDAQDELLSRKQDSAIAVYLYLRELIRLQRALSWFEFDQTDSRRADLIASITAYIGEHRNGKKTVQ